MKKENKKKEQDKNEKDKNEKDKKAKSNKPKKQQEKSENRMTPKQKREDAMRKKELSHMLKALQKKRIPTMMYPTDELKGERNEQNPW